MKHIDNYVVLFHQDDEDWDTISIFQSADKKSLKEQIVRLFIEWEYDESEETLSLIDNIVDALYGDNYYEDDEFKFKIESVPFFN